VAGSCEYVNEPSGFIRCEEFLGQLKACYLLKKDLCPSIAVLLSHTFLSFVLQNNMPEESLRMRITAAIRTVDMLKSSGEVTVC
jgi:hypothetical protein